MAQSANQRWRFPSDSYTMLLDLVILRVMEGAKYCLSVYLSVSMPHTNAMILYLKAIASYVQPYLHLA